MTPYERERAELKTAINLRDSLAEQHFQLGGEHADRGTFNCACDLAKRQRDASDNVQVLVQRECNPETDINRRIEAARREERKRCAEIVENGRDVNCKYCSTIKREILALDKETP